MNNKSFAEFICEYRNGKYYSPKEYILEPTKLVLKNGIEIILRLEEKKDHRETEEITRLAFWNDENKKRLGADLGADEHYLLHTFRSAPEFVKELDFVAQCNGKIIGNVVYCISYILKESGEIYPTLIFGPLSVLPEYQKQGVGSALMRHSLKVAASLSYSSVFCFGHHTYYPRFGFVDAKEYNITTADGKNFPAFMALELLYGALQGVSGSFHFTPLYEPDIRDSKEFDKGFPPM